MSLHTIVLASGNKGKLRELQQLLASVDIHLALQQDYEVPEAEETGLSFIENAIIKARNACLHTGLPALADDSGLEVDALRGEPGIYSARYSGPEATDASNNEKLLREMQGIPDEQRSARYQCVIAYMRHATDPCPLVCQGSWEGSILHQPRGEQGFGYDPLFLVPGQKCSAAQLSPKLKSSISHRAKAMAGLVAQLNQLAAHA